MIALRFALTIFLIFCVYILFGQSRAFARPLNDSKLRFSSQVLDLDSASDTTPVALSDRGELLLKLSSSGRDTYLLRASTGEITDLSALYPNLSFLDFSSSGLLITGAFMNSAGGCAIKIIPSPISNKDKNGLEIALPTSVPCAAFSARIASDELFSIMLRATSGSSPIPETLLLFSKGTVLTKIFGGQAPGFLDYAVELAGFRGSSLVTNLVAGSTTPQYSRVALSPNGAQREFAFSTAVPTESFFMTIKRFVNSNAVLLTNDFSGCGAYVARAQGAKLFDIKRILKRGACVQAKSINSKARAVGCAIENGTCTPFYWDRKSRFVSLPSNLANGALEWASVSLINSRNTIVGTATTESGRNVTVLLTPLTTK